jgi:hypothetical protein
MSNLIRPTSAATASSATIRIRTRWSSDIPQRSTRKSPARRRAAAAGANQNIRDGADPKVRDRLALLGQLVLYVIVYMALHAVGVVH